MVSSASGTCLATDAKVASTFFSKFAGPMLRKGLPEGGGLVILSGGPIHVLFMRFALDIAHTDQQGNVLRVLRGIKPWRLGAFVRKCRLPLSCRPGRRRAQEDDVTVLEGV
jgi:hypothetical protein